MTFASHTPAQPAASALEPGWAPRCAVFDCDGVLMDTERQWVDSVATVSRRYGLPEAQELAERLTGLTAEQIAERVAEAVRARGAESEARTAGDLGRRILEELTTLDEQRLAGGVDLVPGALELVRSLSAVMPVAVASNSRRGVLDLKMRSGGYAPLLSTWVSTEDVPEGKPAPDMYAEAVRRMGFAPDQAVAFEDSVPGATAAVRAGTRVVGLVPASPDGSPRPEPGFPAPALTTSFEDPGFLATVRGWTEAAARARD